MLLPGSDEWRPEVIEGRGLIYDSGLNPAPTPPQWPELKIIKHYSKDIYSRTIQPSLLSLTRAIVDF